jgi:hypothetical protein
VSAAFTPGPWRLRIDPYEDDPFPGKDFFVVRLGDDAIQGITEPANARLIATAPELYTTAYAFLEAYNEGGDSQQLAPFVIELGRALRKAAGDAL